MTPVVVVRWEIWYADAAFSSAVYEEDERARMLLAVASNRRNGYPCRMVKVTTRQVKRTWWRNGYRLFAASTRSGTGGEWMWRVHGAGSARISVSREAAIAAANAWADAQPRGPGSRKR